MGSTLHWISEKILWAVGLVPAVFVTEDSPNFKLIRGIFALLLIVFVVYIIALRPIRSVIRRCKNKTANIVTRKR
jgi:hypothetical protein